MLSALIGKSLKLQRAGNEWRAPCPFHNEKTPSFYVNDDKGFYHCFGCSAHGDAIRWLTEQQGLPFIDAVKELAANAGMTMPAPDPHAAERAEQQSGLHDVIAAAQDWFAGQLAAEDGAAARAYLARRGLSDAMIGEFGLGLAPDSRTKLKAALSRFGDSLLVEAGLLIAVEDKAPYDRFRGRLMIPIRDPRGRVIAFGGRILGPSDPKYLNSPDTPLFDKGRTLYNLDRAAPAARKAGRLIVVEGYMDVIALAQAGIGESVAPLGTALTEAQLERLWRLVDVPVLCFDGDNAGQKAAMRAAVRAMPMIAPGKSLSFALLPTGQDPDDLIREKGRGAFDAILAAARPLVEHIWVCESAASPLGTPEQKAGLKARLDAHVATIADGDVRRHYAREMRERFDTAFFATRAQLPFVRGQKYRPAPAPPSRGAQAVGNDGIDFSRAIFAGLVRHPAMIAICCEALAVLPISNSRLSELRRVLVDAAYDSAVIESSALQTICEAAGLSDMLTELRAFNGLAFSFLRSDADQSVARRDLALAIEALAARPEIEAALAVATARLATYMDDDGLAEQQRLMAAQQEANGKLAALVERADGDIELGIS